jgi:GNAT superfamily N-acetyltransferase
MDSATLRRYGSRGTRELMDTLVAIHSEIHADLPFGRDEYFGAEAFRQRLRVALWQPRFELCLAEVDGSIAGVLYGWTLPAYTRWWKPLAGALPEDMTAETGHRSVFIQEIMVRRRWQRRGIAHRMHDVFLAGRAERRALLCVLPGNEPAVCAYRRWGWHTVASAAPAPGEPTFDWMVHDLSCPSRRPDEIVPDQARVRIP